MLLFLPSWVLVSTLVAPLAHALPPQEDEPDALAPRLDLLDVAPHELWAAGSAVAAPVARGPLWIAVQASIAQLDEGKHSYEAMLLAEIPLERFAASASRAGEIVPSVDVDQDSALAGPWVDVGQDSAFAGPWVDVGQDSAFAGPSVAEGPAPRLKPPPRASNRAKGPPTSDGGASPGAAPSPAPAPPFLLTAEPRSVQLQLPARITPAIARAAVRAALLREHLADPEGPIDALASRARTAALLPELRLRISRLVDDSQSLSPTEYDPERTTATGGVSLWLEARATWRLDRVVFADEEIALERLRRERAEAQAKLTARVLDLLFAWQRAVAREADPGRTPEEHLAATLEVLEAEASLDLITDGWFTRWRASQPAASPSGDEDDG